MPIEIKFEQMYAFLKSYMNITREEFNNMEYWQVRVFIKSIEDKLILESNIRYKELVVLNYNKYSKNKKLKLWD